MSFFKSLNHYSLEGSVLDGGSLENKALDKSSQTWLTLCQYDKQSYNQNLWRDLGVPYDGNLGNAVIKRKAEFLAGRYSAKCALDKLNIQKWQVKTGRHRQPLWPDKVIGSITHSSQFAAAVVSNNAAVEDVGVDIESVMDSDIADSVAPVVMSARERDYCQSLEHDYLPLFTLVYSAKEAIFKAWYSLVEQYFDFDAVELLAIDLSTKCFSFKVCSPLLLANGSAQHITGWFEFFNHEVLSVVMRYEADAQGMSEHCIAINLPELSSF